LGFGYLKIEFCLELKYSNLGFILFIPEQARLSKRKMQPASAKASARQAGTPRLRSGQAGTKKSR
jgi:hypothetical protein